MRPTYTIVDIFETPARAAVLRALATARMALSVRAVAREAGISHTAAGSVLHDLDSMGMVRWANVGRARAYVLERGNVYVRHMVLPAIEAEDAIVTGLCEDLRATFSDPALSIILFGSYAYGEQYEASDIDVFALAVDARRKQELEEIALREHARFWSTYGASLSLLVSTLADAREHLQIDRSAFRLELESTGIILHGLGPSEWRIDD